MKLLVCLLVAGCAHSSDWIDEVRFVHGAPAHGVPGPWALAGYRIGAHALKTLGLPRGAPIQVTHRSPQNAQYTCMVDGLMAATGASPGKMTIRHELARDLETLITYRDRTLRYTLDDAFAARISRVDTADFPASADLLRALPDHQILVVR